MGQSPARQGQAGRRRGTSRAAQAGSASPLGAGRWGDPERPEVTGQGAKCLDREPGAWTVPLAQLRSGQDQEKPLFAFEGKLHTFPSPLLG